MKTVYINLINLHHLKKKDNVTLVLVLFRFQLW